MKKFVLILLCFVLLTGCAAQQKAEPFYETVNEDVVFTSQYKYYFDDENYIVGFWVNSGDQNYYFHDTFELHKLGSDGEWYVVGDPEEVSFYTDYSHFVEPSLDVDCRAGYEISLFTDKLEKGQTYRISTYFFDADGNYYQAYAEFICDNALAEEEMLEITDGMVGNRRPISGNGGTLEVIESSDEQ